MRETRRGGGLFGMAALLVLVMLAGVWFAGGRQAWNRYQLRSLLRGALQAYKEGREAEGDRLAERAKLRADPSALPPGPEKDLYNALLGFWVRRAYEEQLRAERQTIFIGPMPAELVELRDLRSECRKVGIPCPAWMELVAAHVDSRDLNLKR